VTSHRLDQPNIILIMTDQQRGDCLGIEGHPVLMTPNLDELAAGGVRFTSAYSSCPSCIAARRSLLSGQFPSTHGVVGFQKGIAWEPEATLPGELSRAGYQTFMVGRSMHQHPGTRRFGYDHMELVSAEPGPDSWGHGLTGNSWTARPWHLDERRHLTYRTAEQAARFFQKYRDPSCPFFLTVSFAAPHPPLCPPPFYMDRYLRMDLPPPVIGDWADPPQEGKRGFGVDSDHVRLEGEALRSCKAGYFGLINHVDDQILRVLRTSGVDPVTGRATRADTVVIFTSDHGEMLGDHYLFRKTYPYEGSARVPLIIRPTSDMGIDPGRVCRQPVCLEDIMPTILDMAGLAIPDCVDGRSLLPLMTGGTSWRPFLQGEHAACYSEQQANHYLTDGRWKYIWYSCTGHEQLFDLGKDPNELHDLARTPARRKELLKWRSRLIDGLKGRPEGFTDGRKLIPGRPHCAVVPCAKPGA